LNNQIQQLVYAKNKITQQKPNPITATQKDIAILFHVFYIDIWKEIKNYLDQLNTAYDLYITVPESMTNEDILRIFNDNPNVTLYKTENRGRDVLPFLQVMNIIGTDTYKYICKLHTKKTGESALGNVWRKLLYFDLVGSNTVVEQIISLFKNNRNIGIVTGKNTILDSQRYAYGNNKKIDILSQKTGLFYDEYYLFPAGTMFWAKSEIIEPIVKLFRDKELEFEEEAGQKDDTLAHAIERFFGIVCQAKGEQIVESPALYSALPDKTLNEVASLVLSQQYVGVDVFTKQKHQIEIYQNEIKNQEKYIKQLEELAQSLRIKNRIKNFIPDKVMPLHKKIVKMPKKIVNLLMLIRHNPSVIKKVFYYAKKGELKYLITKIKEKSRNNLSESQNLVNIKPNDYFITLDKEKYMLGDICVDIIMPVYNGYEFLEKLFDSIEKNTTSPYRLIVINDCSPDSRVRPYLLERLEKHPTSIFIDRETNQGFLKSVNEAYRNVSNHFLLLNTDTEVPEFWIERLMYPIIYMDKVASTTPFTNSGEIASFPNFVADNEIFDGMSVDNLDAVFRDVNPQSFYAEIPTGVGFCMGVNYTLTKEIGMFAEDTFGKGYGEENDWCQRAIQKGYRNFLVPNLFVYHKHGGSFSAEEKQALLKVNAVKLLDRHPDYGKDVNTYIQKDPHNTLRHLLVVLASSKSVGTHLIFDHNLGGGANIYANELIEQYTHKKINTLLIKYDFYSNSFKLFHRYKEYEFNFKISTFEELQLFIGKLNIKEIFLNSLVSFKNCTGLLEYFNLLINDTKGNLIIPIHDYYVVCPSYTLINEKGKYCNVPSLEECKACMEKNTQEWRNYYNEEVDMTLWRKQWSKILRKSSRIICFSLASKEIVLKAYPDLESDHIEVIPHTVKELSPVIKKEKTNTTVTIGILGAINYAKGSQVIKHLVQTIDRDKLDMNVVVVGEMADYLKSENFSVTGRYAREDLPNIVQDENIDIFFIPSIWPETFSYTTQEIMMLGLPLMVFNLGAPAERVIQYDKGYVIDDVSVEAVLNTVNTIVDNFKD